jgi:hypothetical protein
MFNQCAQSTHHDEQGKTTEYADIIKKFDEGKTRLINIVSSKIK